MTSNHVPLILAFKMTFEYFEGDLEGNLEGDLEGDLEVDLEGDLRGDFKQDLEGNLLSSSGQLSYRSGSSRSGSV